MAHRARALGHPMFLAALALLVINDHVLKRAGVLPGWLTGKLSDFAGLIVAPVVAIVLLGLERRRARAVAFAAIALAFAMLEISPRSAALWDAALGALGMPSRSWPDPSDLVALAVLPIAWVIASTGDRSAPSGGLALATQQALLGVALFACIATSRAPEPLPPQWFTNAWLRNRTAESIDVRIRWSEGPLDCALLASGDVDVAAAASPEIFGSGITFRLAPGDVVPIEPLDAAAAAEGTADPFGRVPPPEPRHPCELARVSVDGLDESVVFWVPGGSRDVLASQPERDGEGDPEDAAELAVDEADGTSREGALRLRAGGSYRVATLRERAPPIAPTCGGARGETLGFGGIAREGLRATISQRALLPDGCLQLDLVEGATLPEHASVSLVLCAPGDLVPFDVSDSIVVEVDASGTRLELRDDQAIVAEPRRLIVFAGATEPFLGDALASPDAPTVACAERLGCGAYVAPVPSLRARAGALAVGELVDRSDDARRTRVLVSRAEHVIVAHAGCDAGRDAVGPRIDAVVLIEPIAPEVLVDEGGGT